MNSENGTRFNPEKIINQARAHVEHEENLLEQLENFMEQRNQIMIQLQKINAEIQRICSRFEDDDRVGKRYLGDVLVEYLQVHRSASVEELTNHALKDGYKTRSQNFRRVVNQALRSDPRFRRTKKRGYYYLADREG